MNLHIKEIILVLLVFVLFSCEKNYDFGPLTDKRPDIPVTVSNASEFRPGPTVRASKADGKIQIILQIPAAGNRTIKEITKVAAATTFTAIQGSTGLYTTTPIAGSGTMVTFNTTFTEFTTKTGQAIPASNAELTRRFYFYVTLDDGSVIIPNDVRVLVVD